MKTIKITKIYNGNFPILKLSDNSDKCGRFKYKNSIGKVYEIIEVPDDVKSKELLSALDPNNLPNNKLILKFSEI